MDNEKHWHTEVIPEAAEHVIEVLLKIGSSPFYLAGGTGLALNFGHRLSRDFDLFTGEFFDEESLLSQFKDIEKISVVSKGRETLHLQISGIKVSFLGYHYPLLFPFQSFLSLNMADCRDIACMKISAIAGRGARRDFVDLYISAQHYGLALLLDLFKKKYAQIDLNMVHVLKSLTYFKDAEDEPMPKMLSPIAWDQVTAFFRRETLKLI